MNPVASTKMAWLEDVKKYSFCEVSKLFGVLVERNGETQSLRVYEFSKRSFCWVQRGSFLSISFLNDHILKIDCFMMPFKHIFIDLARGVKITSDCREFYFNSEYMAEVGKGTIVVRALQTIEKVFKFFNHSDHLILRCLSGSQMICHEKERSLLGYSDWLYVLDQAGLRPLTHLSCHIVFHRYYTSIVAKGYSSSDVRSDIEKLKKIPELSAHFKNYPWIFGSAPNFFGICHNAISDQEFTTLETPYFLHMNNNKLLIMSPCENAEYENTTFCRRTKLEYHITTAHGSSDDFILVGERENRFVYDVEQGRIVHTFKTVD